jgi:hypothetical protein
MIARWFADGKPLGKVRHPRFPEYSDVVGGILENAARAAGGGWCGFLWNINRYTASCDEGSDGAADWIHLCAATHGFQAMQARDMVACTKGLLGEAIVALPGVLSGADENTQAKQVEPYLRSVLRRTFMVDFSQIKRVGVDLKGPHPVRLVQCRDRNPAKYRLVVTPA